MPLFGQLFNLCIAVLGGGPEADRLLPPDGPTQPSQQEKKSSIKFIIGRGGD